MLQLYGNSRSRAMRCLWMLEEMGKPYQLMEKTTRVDDLLSAEYLRLNPNARIPTLVDGDLVLWESMAVNLYLAQKYEGPNRKSWVWLFNGASGPCWKRKRYCLIC
jgi:glutathione S-transferase